MNIRFPLRAIAPTVPLDLTQYICEQFVELRQRSAEGETGTGGNNWKSNRKSNKTDQAVMTARQLLSILRLSQGLARLALRNTISHEDVDEAMRLTHASKSSLADDDQYNRTAQEDVVSAIYTIMRDFAAQRGTNIVEFNHIELMILKKGFSNQQLRNCLEEYESLGVLSFDEQASKITFDQ